MKMYLSVALWACVYLLVSATHVLADEKGDELRNPFTRPPIAPKSVPGQAFVMNVPTFELRATLAAGADSLVNIDGNIIALGEVFAGYRLIEVGEGTAVFRRNGVSYPLSVSRNGANRT